MEIADGFVNDLPKEAGYAHGINPLLVPPKYLVLFHPFG